MQILKVTYNVFKQAADLLKVYYFEESSNLVVASCGTNEFVYLTRIQGPDLIDFNNNYLLSAIQLTSTDDVIALPTINALQTNQNKYDETANAIYVGSARPNSLDTDDAWTIAKYNLDNEGNVISKQQSLPDVKWSERLIISYN